MTIPTKSQLQGLAAATFLTVLMAVSSGFTVYLLGAAHPPPAPQKPRCPRESVCKACPYFDSEHRDEQLDAAYQAGWNRAARVYGGEDVRYALGTCMEQLMTLRRHLEPDDAGAP